MKNLFKGWAGLIALALVAMVTMVSCGEEEPETPIVEDGLYVMGPGTALAELDIDGMLEVTRNERIQEDRATLKEIYIAVSAGGEFNLVNVVGGVSTTWGPAADFHSIEGDEKDLEEPGNGLWRGSYEESTTPFTVPEDGLYHIALDTEVGKVIVAKVVWGVIGAASPGGWSGSTNLDATFDLNMMDFSGTEIAMKKGDYKFRYSDGWKVYLDTVLVINEEKKGVVVNTNYGTDIDALVAGGDNINMTDHGYYTVSMKWELGVGTTCTMTRTGDLPSTDYSSYEMGFVGDGVDVSAGTPHNWDSTIEKMTPSVDGSTYTWAWTGILVNADGAFKVRQGDTWDELILGYDQFAWAGSGADNFSNADSNIKAAAAGTYDFTMSVDGTTDEFTMTVEPSSK